MRRILLVLAVLATSGCGTIIHGSSQSIGLSSTPTDARVWVDKQELGKTPMIATLSRKDNHVIRMELAGYQPFEATITRSVSGWVVGNLVFGGLVGLAVDAISGGLYKLTPDQVAGQLAKQSASVERVGNGLYVTVVLQPDPSWERVGRLQRQ
ncbi:MAG TPA: PEGA domain-containing protein [Gemmatimonadaceae bacterium]|nr:PEGA domain-containing protein [Gemmatimonadaceae bacterium]